MVEITLAAVPQLLDQLEVAISKQAKIGGGGKAGKGSAHLRMPLNWGAVDARDQLLIDVAFIGDDIDQLRSHVKVAELVSNLGKSVKEAYRVIDRARDRQYLGVCNYEEDGAVCHAELWAKPKVTSVRCTQCEFVHDVAERQEWLLDQAEDLIVTPREASRYVGAVGGITVGHQRIRNYLDRGQLTERPSHDGSKRFRFGDLLAILRRDATRHDARAS
jgi:hypothetical protein